MRIYVGIPCYKTAETIGGVLRRLAETRSDVHLIVVNDGSPDGLDEVLAAIDTSAFLSFHYRKHPRNRGYGGAQKTIFKTFQSLAKHPSDILIIVHGDGQTAEREIEKFIETARAYPYLDAIVGSRMLNSFRVQSEAGRPAFKIISDYALTAIQNKFYNLRLSTYASGYRCYTKKGIDKLDFSDTSDGHAFDTESLIQFRLRNIKFKEIPVSVVPGGTASANRLKTYARESVELARRYAYSWRAAARRYLIINSDDYGYSPSVNIGVAEAFSRRMITSASIMTNTGHFDDAVSKARAGNFQDRIGVHLNLTQGRPLGGNYRTLTNEKGELPGIASLIVKSKLKKLDYDEVLEESGLQIKKALDSGIAVSHLDSHEWSQIVPEVSRAMISLAEKYAVACARALQETRLPGLLAGASSQALMNSLAVALLKTGNASDLERSRVQTPDHYAGIMISGHGRYVSALRRLLANLEPGVTELMCHLGSRDFADLKGKSYFTEQRHKEFLALSSREIRDIIKEKEIELISYTEFAKL